MVSALGGASAAPPPSAGVRHGSCSALVDELLRGVRSLDSAPAGIGTRQLDRPRKGRGDVFYPKPSPAARPPSLSPAPSGRTDGHTGLAARPVDVVAPSAPRALSPPPVAAVGSTRPPSRPPAEAPCVAPTQPVTPAVAMAATSPSQHQRSLAPAPAASVAAPTSPKQLQHRRSTPRLSPFQPAPPTRAQNLLQTETLHNRSPSRDSRTPADTCSRATSRSASKESLSLKGLGRRQWSQSIDFLAAAEAQVGAAVPSTSSRGPSPGLGKKGVAACSSQNRSISPKSKIQRSSPRPARRSVGEMEGDDLSSWQASRSRVSWTPLRPRRLPGDVLTEVTRSVMRSRSSTPGPDCRGKPMTLEESLHTINTAVFAGKPPPVCLGYHAATAAGRVAAAPPRVRPSNNTKPATARSAEDRAAFHQGLAQILSRHGLPNEACVRASSVDTSQASTRGSTEAESRQDTPPVLSPRRKLILRR
eukprot:TRINITY_DN9535_c0_g1_i1.p1 TRINITY_DN9535_c0_g1~~TRINITY_DN9535_c0_g1_i1.p1  ORF type:complete len:475 (+),score=62.04 TRINITY_DN9535_c0_g1_i1:71-1495(+)